MKLKYLTFAVMAGAALVGCTKTEPAPVQGASDTPIVFATPVHTKAEVYGEISGTKYNVSEKFAVWGIRTIENKWASAPSSARTMYMGTADGAGVICEHRSGTFDAWYPTVDYYWPKDGYITFVAVSPSDVPNATLSLTGGFKVTDYVTPVQAQQYDLMYSDISPDWQGGMFSTTPDNSDDDNSQYTYAGVDINFRHALSSIKFTAVVKEAYSGTEITVKSIKLKGVNQKGDFVADFNNPRTEEWNLSTASEDIKEYTIYSSTEGTKLSVKPVGGEAPLIGDTYLLIPQNLTSVKVEIEYTQKNPGGVTINQKAEIDLYGNKGTYKEDSTEHTINEWEKGRRYTYNLVFSLNKIYFDPATVDWLNTEVSLPIIPGA